MRPKMSTKYNILSARNKYCQLILHKKIYIFFYGRVIVKKMFYFEKLGYKESANFPNS